MLNQRIKTNISTIYNKYIQMEEYISHEDYKQMMENFKQGTPKGLLKEDLEKEGNAFTAGLAKAKKGQEFKVGDKEVKDTSNYDSSMEEEMHSFDSIKKDTPHAHKLKVNAPNLTGTIFKNEDGTYVFYDVDNYNADPSLPPFKTITDLMTHFGIKMQDLHEDLEEYQFDQMYPDDPGPFEAKEGICPGCGMPASECQCGQEMGESHEGNDQWYDAFSDALAQLHISDKARKLVDRALSHADVTSTYGEIQPQEAAKEFVRDIVAMFKTQVKEDATGDEPFADFYKNAIESASGDKISHTELDDYDRTIYWGTKDPNVTYYMGDNHDIIRYNGETGERYPIGSINDYDEPIPDYEPDTDADYEEPRDDFDMAEVKKFQEIAGVGPQDDGPEDDDDEAREKRAHKEEEEDTEAENAEREIDEEAHADGSHMRDPDTAAKTVAEKHGAELKPLYDKYQVAWEQHIKDVNNKELSKVYNALVKEFQNDAINWCGHEMLEAGMKRVQVSNLLSGYGYFEDWLSDYITAIGKELKGMAEGLHMPPLQATGPTVDTNEGMHMPPLQATGNSAVKEDQAPFGFSVLSPDERKQLKEYINSMKTIKKEIAGLLEKAGRSGKIMENEKKAEDERVPAARPSHYREPTSVPTQHKSSNLGGNRTGLVMTKAEMWEEEGHEETPHERMDGLVDRKLHDAFQKVTGMIMKELMDDGFDEGDIKNFLQYEIDKKAKEAIMSQHDF